jgi:2-hydroxychromene-2-carboxylate isomerase
VQTIDFHFDFRSPYSHLALTQLRALPARLHYRPMDVLAVMQQVGNTPTSVLCKPKGRYVQQDLQRWAALYGIPFERHPQMRAIDGQRLLRAAVLAVDEPAIDPAASAGFIGAIFDAMWRSPVPLAERDDLLNLAHASGVDRSWLAERLDGEAAVAALAAASEAAAARGVFGAPTMFVGDQMFFGNDRLAFLTRALESA